MPRSYPGRGLAPESHVLPARSVPALPGHTRPTRRFWKRYFPLPCPASRHWCRRNTTDFMYFTPTTLKEPRSARTMQMGRGDKAAEAAGGPALPAAAADSSALPRPASRRPGQQGQHRASVVGSARVLGQSARGLGMAAPLSTIIGSLQAGHRVLPGRWGQEMHRAGGPEAGGAWMRARRPPARFLRASRVPWRAGGGPGLQEGL